MIVAVTGTPGTGKTTAVKEVSTGLDRVHLGEYIDQDEFVVEHDASRESEVVDLETLREQFTDTEDAVIESHLAHYLPADRIVVLRCHPTELADRLRNRGAPPESVQENAESEALDLILTAAVKRHGRDSVYEVETTTTPPAAVATAIEEVIDGTRQPAAGSVSYIEYLTEHDA